MIHPGIDVALEPVIEESWRIRLHRRERVEHGRQQLVLDLDPIEGLATGLLVHGRHGRHRIADIADLLLGQHVLVVARRRGPVEHVRHVGSGEDGLDPWKGGSRAHVH